ncbi:MAG: hypothetical protein ABI347_02795 [Nitrososphaera sp.]
MSEELKLFTLSEAKGMWLFTIEVPANVGKILMDLAIYYDMNHMRYLEDIVLQTVEKELTTACGIDSGLAAFLKKKYNYEPRSQKKTPKKEGEEA